MHEHNRCPSICIKSRNIYFFYNYIQYNKVDCTQTITVNWWNVNRRKIHFWISDKLRATHRGCHNKIWRPIISYDQQSTSTRVQQQFNPICTYLFDLAHVPYYAFLSNQFAKVGRRANPTRLTQPTTRSRNILKIPSTCVVSPYRFFTCSLHETPSLQGLTNPRGFSCYYYFLSKHIIVYYYGVNTHTVLL